jgi:membrane-bound lytic murein transglycosylase B
VLAGCASAKPPIQLAQASVPTVSPQANAKFAAFLTEFRVEALAQGIQPATYDSAMAGLAPIARIEALNAEQPEFTRPVWAYLDTAVSERRIANGKARLTENFTNLANIEQRSGVPKEILVAIWGVETDFGRDVGSFNLFGALATLAYDGPRAAFAKSELIAALKILEQENYAPARMISSWAGAFGQTQFVPSTFLKYATDGDGDGR